MKKLAKIFLIMSLAVLLITTPVFAAIQYNYVTYYMLTSEEITLSWENTNTGTIIFDVYIERVEWDEVVNKYLNISATEYTITLPRAGMYILKVRARKALTVDETTFINAATRTTLLQFIQDNNIVDDVGDTTNLIDQEIKDAIISIGKASTWAKSTTHGKVDDVDQGWWVYAYIAKPGPIIIGSAAIGNTEELIYVSTIWIYGDWENL